MKLKVQYENHYYDEMEEMEEELLAKLGENRHKTGRPIRSVLYYTKDYELMMTMTMTLLLMMMMMMTI